ncbi:MAG: hypothetical protein NTY35_00335 [Planctomycetota bacterium]|nr:hypothetical protein [Planctomycetota bacterium]
MSTQFDPSAIATAAATSHVSTAPAPTRSTGTSANTTIRTLSWVDRLTLGAIGVVVVLVTLPVLRGFGLRENERDALRMLRVLSAEPAAGAGLDAAGQQASLAELAGRDRVLHRRLEDLEMLSDGRLRRHGYLFDVSALGTGEPMLRAWPWDHGQTGRGAFIWTPRRGIQGYRNGDGRFSGPEAPPQAADVLAGDGWVPMPRR